ncbi:uncharacterized protein LOC143458857 isoform X2 [Clavelina lepadiformis]|uniref:uncharacterized protein LOC143458857 isoform X2 n=1 Tax=Clavelina lepadiformis TaxID=159417 RepID=UPI0040420878
MQKLEAENIQLSEKKKDLEGQNEKLAEGLRERDSELKDMQDKLAEEMQNSADLRHKIKNKKKEIQKLRQERVVKKTPRKNRAANPPTLLPSDIIEDYDFNENPISKASRKTKSTTSCKSVASAEDVERKAKRRDSLLKEKEQTLKNNKQQDNKNKTRGRKRTNKQEEEVNNGIVVTHSSGYEGRRQTLLPCESCPRCTLC